jgi:hypothetical protein
MIERIPKCVNTRSVREKIEASRILDLKELHGFICVQDKGTKRTLLI